ncbi:RHS repeat domain-containing protein [Pseudomonas sp.]|uniref:RHS repeat domain-containing protein n=1 Tax=Pseudomonas sp. TaxID=306 RepID=UPI0026190C37|nr:RHS repeat-associated core domain-containing protein [Pseudomonas sp.]
MTLHAHTPILAVTELRGFVVRSVAWYRSKTTDSLQARVNRSAFDEVGRVARQWDARLWSEAGENAAVPANLAAVYSLSGQLLSSDSVDAGWRVGLFSEAGQVHETWDGRGIRRRHEYDALLRPTAVFENSNELVERCVEQLAYGTAGADCVLHNQCGQLIRHDDQAGSQLTNAFGLTGSVLELTQHFLSELQPPDWPDVGRDSLWEPCIGAKTAWHYNPLGDVLAQTDALDNIHTFAHTVAGQLKACVLQLKDQPPQPIVSDLSYDAQGRIESETLGNDVISTSRYREQDGRLIQLRAQRAGDLLQDLHYDYDPVGNVISIEDRSQPTRHFANQRIEPISTYRYDSLYQLIEASGWEAASVNHGPVFSVFQTSPGPSQLANYTQTYDYDAAGNLQQLTHVGAQNHSRTLVTARYSNRSLPQLGDRPPAEEEIAAGFDENGNLRQLQPGQTLEWDSRNQLQQVRPVVRESGNDDSEHYVYDASGQRVRKVRTTQAKSVTHHSEVRYLPGLEIRTNTATGEVLHVITAQAGRSEVRVLHWQAGKPEGIENNQYRYSMSDHLGSSTLELDAEAQMISQEMYYPFGGTACWAGRNAVEASYKTVRYSGKERDATGLYYYGLRYYAPWLQRWINPDPTGAAGGLNLFCFVNNSPLRYGDYEGAAPYDVLGEQEMSAYIRSGRTVSARGLSEFTHEQREKMLRGINLAVKFLKTTRAELSKEFPGRGVSKILTDTFGELYQEHEEQVVNSLKSAFAEQQHFISSLAGASSWKINLFENHPGVLGVTHQVSDYEPERTISMSASELDSQHVLEVARTLIHESSHAIGDTVDIFYHNVYMLSQGADAAEVNAWSKTIRSQSRMIAANGPDVNSLGFNTHMYITAMQAVTVCSVDRLAEEFVSNPFARASVLQMNADTYSSFVMGTNLPERYMSKESKRSTRASGFRKNKEVF